MKSVDVLVGVHGQQSPLLVQVPRQRQLDEQRVDCGIRAERADNRLEVLLGHVPGQFLVHGLDADLVAVLVLHRHVPGARTVVADQDRPEPGGDAGRLQHGDPLGQLGPFPSCERFPVQQDRGHQWRKWRSPVSTIEIPRSSAAAITS